MMARSLEFEELVSALKDEHGGVKRRLAELGDVVAARKYAKASELVPGLCDALRQHIIDEEAKVLKVIIDAYGRERAGEAIRIAQRHRVVHRKIEEMEKLAARTPGMLGPRVVELRGLLEEHFKDEEERMFPLALEAYRGKTKGR